MKKLIGVLAIAIALNACQNDTEKKSETAVTVQETIVENKTDVTGNYVDDAYIKRSEGYDWVGVSVNKKADDAIMVSVRSRSDKKRPTCTFDAVAYKKDDSTYQSVVDGKNILITFHDNSLSIRPESTEDEAVLHFYCSGGATVARTYTKINEPLDQGQIDKTTFNKVLRLQDIGFNISAKPLTGDEQELTILPWGLSKSNTAFVATFKGHVVDAEIEDLDSDGSPEVLVYTQNGDNNAGFLIGVSVNNKRSMSAISFVPAAENPKISQGYNGHDEFSIVENTVAQRFPIFENGKETGKIKQVEYALKKGETAKQLVIKKISEINK